MKNKIKHRRYGIPKRLTCRLCGHVWFSRLERMPANCPRCKRYDYHQKRSRKCRNK